MTERLPRGSLDAEVILRAAEKLAGRRGLAQLTIRGVAAELGVQHTAVHHHFRRRSDLVDALMTAAVERFNAAFPAVGTGDWEEYLRAYWSAYRDVLRADEALFELVVGEWVLMGRSRRAIDLSFRRIDTQLEVLLRAGFSAEQAGYAYHLLSTYTRGCLISEYQFTRSGASREADMHVSAAHLPGDLTPYPSLSRVVAHHWSYSFATDADFEHGLSVILAGLRAALSAVQHI
jgi:TetR/AcrR family tetracycline transcriptional repressor